MRHKTRAQNFFPGSSFSFPITAFATGCLMRRLFVAVTCGLMLSTLPSAAEATVYGVSFYGNLYALDEATGAGSLVGASGYSYFNSMASDTSGTLYSVLLRWSESTDQLITFNSTTGAGTEGSLLDLQDVRAIAFSPDDTLFAIKEGGTTTDRLYTIDVETGVSTLVGYTGYVGMQGLAFDDAGTLYGWEIGAGTGIGLGLVTIDTDTGAVTDVDSEVDGSSDIQTIEFAPDGTLYGARSGLYRIDVNSGSATLIGSGGYSDIRGMAFIPEPSALLLLITGGIGLLALFRARNR